jgi:hypothetical protein
MSKTIIGKEELVPDEFDRHWYQSCRETQHQTTALPDLGTAR